MNNKYKELYAYLSDNNMTDLDENSFYNEYSQNDEKFSKLYSNLKGNKMTDLDPETFKLEYFGTPIIKKKSQVESTDSSLEVGSSERLSTTTTRQLEPSIYILPNNPGALYRKKGDSWLKKIGENYIPLSKGDVRARERILDKQAVLASDFQADWYSNQPKEIPESQYATQEQVNKAYPDLPKERWKGATVTPIDQTIPTEKTRAFEQEEAKDSILPEEKIEPATYKEKLYMLQEGKDNENFYKNPVTEETYLYWLDNNGKPREGLDPIKSQEAVDLAANIIGEPQMNQLSKINKIDKIDLNKRDVDKFLKKELYGSNFGFNQEGNELTINSYFPGMNGDDEGLENSITIDLSKSNSSSIAKEFLRYNLFTKKENESLENIKDTESYIDAMINSNGKIKMTSDRVDVISEWARTESMAIENDIKRNEVDVIDKDIKSYEEKTKLFKKRVASGNMTQQEFDKENDDLSKLYKDISIKQKRAQELSNRAQKLISAEELIQKKVTPEEKGSTLGALVKSFTSGMSNLALTGLDYSLAAGNLIMGDEKFSKLIDGNYGAKKAKGLTDAQIANAAQATVKDFAKEKYDLGWENITETNKEYIRSENRGMIPQALNAVAESFGTAATGGALGKVGSTAAFFSMSYNAMEDQMRGPDFDHLNENEKKLISVPYGLVIGQMEKWGFDVAVGAGKNPLFNKFANYIVTKTFKNLPKNAGLIELNSAIQKNIGASIAKGLIKITGAGVSEGNVEFMQQEFEGIQKFAVNEILKNDNFNEEYFKDAPDLSKAGGWSTLLDQGVDAFKLGFLAGGMTSAGASVKDNITDISSNNKFDIYKSFVLNTESRNGWIASIKEDQKNGKISPEEMNKQIDELNKSYSVLTKIPASLTTQSQREAFSLLQERENIENEIKDKDPNLVVKETNRIKEINESLKTTSENATKENNIVQQEGTAEGGISEYQGTGEGQQEGGVSQGGQRETTINEADSSDSTVASKVQEEELELDPKKAAEDFKENYNNGKLTKGDFGGGRNLGVFDYKGKIIKVVKKKRRISPDQIQSMKDRLGDMDNVYFPEESIDLGDNKEAIVMSKAKGIDASNLTKEDIDNIPQEHWDKFEQDVRELSKRGVQVDLTKRDNLFYDKSNGFQFIDINGISMDESSTDKFFEKDGIEYYYPFEQYRFFPNKFEGGKVMFESIPEYNTKSVQSAASGTTQKSDQVATLRAEEQAELLKAIPKIESYKVNGEIDKTLMPKTVLAKYNKIYDKYDKLISPLLETTGEVAIDKPVITTNTTAEVERVKSLSFEAEDGATFNIDGTKYEGVGLVVAVDSMNTTTEELTPEMVADFVAERQKMIGDAGVVKAGIYKFPNSNQVSIDLSVVVPETSREQALEFARLAGQESLFDLETFENIKTGATGENPMKFTPEQHREISKALKEGRMPNVFGTTAETTNNLLTKENVKEFASKQKTTAHKLIVKAAKMVLNAIPGIKIYIHNNGKELVSAIESSKKQLTKEEKTGLKESSGIYVDGDIHINLESATIGTVYHEAFHALTEKMGMSSEATLLMAKGLKNIISDKDIKQKLENFISQYETEKEKFKEEIEKENKKRIASGKSAMNEKETDEYVVYLNDLLKSDEFLAELTGILSEAEQELTTTKLQQFKTLINNIAKKLGLPVIFSASATAQDAADFINTMSKKLRTGEEIENIVTDGIQLNVVNPTGIKKQIEFKNDYKLSFVKKEDIINIEELIKNISESGQKVWFWMADQLGRGYVFDEVSGEEHYLDAGPSFALDPKNKSKRIIWASGKTAKDIQKLINNSDYIFLVSGNPETAKLFNKAVFDLYTKKLGDYNSFKKEVLSNKPRKEISEVLNAHDSWETLREDSSTDNTKTKKIGTGRKKFLMVLNDVVNKPNATLNKILKDKNAIIDINSIRDDFYADNGFKQNDIMLVLKAEKLGGKSDHSTYENDLIGDVVGVPDKKINAYDILSDEDKARYKDASNSDRNKQQAITAPYGSGIRNVQSSKIKFQKNKTDKLTAPVAGNKLFNEPLKQALDIAKSYMKSIGEEYSPVEKITKLDEDLSKRISDAYDKMKDDPTDPEVKAAYEAMVKETLDQYDAITAKGYKLEINNNEPYSSSEDMINDLRDNNRMKIFSTESGFGEEPITDKQREENILLKDSGRKDANGETLLVNDVFRFVHDFFGHAKLGNSFGPIGEENAWRVHSEMYSPEAKKAMTSETRGQNSWVNFSGVNDAAFKKREKARQLRKEGKIDQANQMVGEVYDEMKFADQKIGLLPSFAVEEGATSKIKKQLTTDKYAKPGAKLALDELGETNDQREAWRKNNKVNQKQKRNPIVEQAVKDYYNEKINQEQYLDIVAKNQPIKPFKTVPALPSLEDITNSLDISKVATGIIGLTKNLENGEKVASRLDIPAYEDYDTWVVSLHDGNKEGKSIAYGQTAVLKNVDFKTFPGSAIRIAMGTQNKSTIGRMFGDWVNEDPELVHARAKELINDPAWTQVGMNPFRYSWFYDKSDGMPVASADEVIQVGALVLAKNAKKVLPSDPIFETKSAKGGKIKFQKPDTGEVTVSKIREASKKDLLSRQKKMTIIDRIRFIRNKIIDRQSDIKRLIKGIGSKESIRAYNLLVSKAGASGFANYRFKNAEADIYKGLSKNDLDTLEDIIYARRMVAINESRAKKGAEPYTGMDGYSEVKALNDLDAIKNKIGEKKFNDLSKRATIYFGVFSENLKKLYESGRINEETYINLRDIEYSPIRTIKYIIGYNLDAETIDKEASKLGVSKKDIMALTDSNENAIIFDSKWLLLLNVMSVEGRAFENKMLNEFSDAIDGATQEQRDAISEFIIDNPIVKQTSTGSIQYKYNQNNVPVGYSIVSFFKNGVKKDLVVKEAYATQLLDIKSSNQALNLIGTLTGAKILRFFATGGNPLFIIGNTAVDFQNILFFSDVYSKFKLFGGAQLSYDFVRKFLKGVSTSNRKNKIYNEYVEHGGAMDFLSKDGLRALKSLSPKNKILNISQKVLIGYGNIMSYLGEKSELAFRLAVYDKVKGDEISKFKKENGRDPDAKELDDIMYEATRNARETMDFNQGGTWVKAADNMMPYLNASMQGFRRPLEYAKNNPLGFTSSLVQASIMAGSVAAMSLAALMRSVEDDDDEEKKKILDVLESLSDYEKATHHIIFTGKKDKDGEYEYYRIKKLPVLSVISTITEQFTYKYLLSEAGIKYDVDQEVINKSISASTPFTPSDIASRNPLISGLLTYSFNWDSFTGEKIFREPRDKKIAATAEGMYDDKVEQIYKEIAPSLGLSPIRTKAAIEKIVTSENTNPMISIFYASANGFFNKDGYGAEFSDAFDNVFDASARKLKRTTNKDNIRYKEEDNIENREMIIETDIYNKEQKVYNTIKNTYKDGKELSNGELVDLIKNNFEKKDYKKYAKKYYAYIKNMNIDRSVLDILYEDTPEVQALRLYNRYGSELDSEEKKVLSGVMRKANMRLSKQAIYIYNKKYSNRK